MPTVGWPQTRRDRHHGVPRAGAEHRHGTIHGPGYSGGNALSQEQTFTATRFDDDFHVFTVEWDADRIDWFVDGLFTTRSEGAGARQVGV